MLPKAGFNDIALVAKASCGQPEFTSELGHVVTTDIGQLNMFQMVPDTIVGIQLRRVTRQTFKSDACHTTVCQEVLHRLAPMDRRSIPDHQELAWDVPKQVLEEAHHVFAMIGPFLC